MLGYTDWLNSSKIPKCSVTHQEKIQNLELRVITHYTAT